MSPEVRKQIEALGDLTVPELRERYAEVFGEETRSRHRRFLIKRICWGLQAQEEGGLSEKALKRARELARDSDLRLLAPNPARPGKTVRGRISPSQDPRLPMPGVILTRTFKGRIITCAILEQGFDFEGKVFRSLSAVARAATGVQWNGYAFFGLDRKGARR